MRTTRARVRESRRNNAKPFSRLIYPMPNDVGLGVHVTIDTGACACVCACEPPRYVAMRCGVRCGLRCGDEGRVQRATPSSARMWSG